MSTRSAVTGHRAQTHADELLGVLRLATRDRHARLDSSPTLAALVGGELVHDAYGAALLVLSGPQAMLEQTLGESEQLARNVPPRLPDLLADLDELGRMPAAGAVTPLRVAHPAERVGIAYVLHGSRLGARGIANAVRRSLGGDVPLRFFGDAALTRTEWRATWLAIASLCDPRDTRHAVRGAVGAFDAMLAAVSPGDRASVGAGARPHPGAAVTLRP